MSDKYKKCYRCKEFKSIDEFYKDNSHLDGLRSQCINCVKKYVNKYYQSHKVELKKYKKKYMNKKNRTDINFKLAGNLRCRIWHALKSNKKSNKTKILIGCSIDFLKQYLEQRFVVGMNWNNYGIKGWHIDHIRPCCSFDLSENNQQEKCFHYTNLQPLWAEDNWSKGRKFLRKEKIMRNVILK